MTLTNQFRRHYILKVTLCNKLCLICNIEIIKDGAYFVVKVHLADGSIREYRHHVFEDVLTEMVIDLQDEQSE